VRLNKKDKARILAAIRTAKSAVDYMRFKWEGSYGLGYHESVRSARLSEIAEESNDLCKLKKDVKGA